MRLRQRNAEKGANQMKEFTRIITVQIEATSKDVDEKKIRPIKEAIELIKTKIDEAIDATYVNVTEAKDFIKD